MTRVSDLPPNQLDESGSGCSRRSQLSAAGWLLAWIACASFAPLLLDRELLPERFAWLVILVPTLVGVVAVVAFRRFVVQADEMLRKIQMEGLAVGFGVGVVTSVTLELIEQSGGPRVELAWVSAAMLVSYSIAVILGTRRYA